MPRTKQLVSALALALAGMGTAQAQEFSAVISFGDSLSDAGQYAALPPPFYFGAQGSFTTNPDDVWTQVLASAYGLSQTASLAGGTNYAWGGAPTAFTIPPIPLTLKCVPATLPCASVQQQIGTYLTSTGGAADPNALYTYWAGANDIFNYLQWAGPQVVNPGPPPVLGPPLITAAQAQLFTGASALTALAEIGALQAAGAENIVVLNLPDIGLTPSFRGTAAQGSVSGLVFVYNNVLNDGLASLDDGIIPINAYQLINEVLADPAAFGFSNATSPACNPAGPGGGSSLFCTPASYVAPGANETYLFADGVHPSGAAHAMLAEVVQATIAAPGQFSMAGEMPLLVYENHANVVNTNIFRMDRIGEKGEAAVYGALAYGRADFDATVNTAPWDGNVSSATLGADVRASDNISFGGAITFGATRGDSHRSDIDGKEVLASVYGVVNWGMGYLSGMISGGSMSLDMSRAIDFRAHTRAEQGDTSAQHLAFEIGGGFVFGNDEFRHGPFASYTDQDIDVRGFSEDSLDSTSMWFDDYTRNSQVWRVGYQASGSFGAVNPYGRVAYAQDDEDQGVQVQAGSNTMNGHFTMPGFIPDDRWVEADLGLAWAMAEDTELTFAWRGHFNNEGQEYNSLQIGFRKEFGVAAPVVVEEPAPEPVQTCADLDDDGDGLNNCDDKCPTTPSGEAVGPDGCPVPVEPELAPKPYRN